MAITYDAPSNTITVTGYTEGTPCTFLDIYNADVAGGWGVVTAHCSNTQFCFSCKLVIGDGSTATWFADTNKQIVFTSSCVSANYDILMEVTNNAHLRLGTIENASEKLSSSGCSIFSLDTSYLYIHIVRGTGSTSADIKILSCHFYSAYTSVWHPDLKELRNSAPVWNCIFHGVEIGSGSVDLYNCIFYKTYYPIQFGVTGTFDRIFIHNTYRAFYFRAGYATTHTNYLVKDLDDSNSIYAYIMTGDNTLIDCELPNWNISWSGASTHKIYRKYTFNLQVFDESGTAVNGATVTLMDNGGTPTFNVATAADGTIAEQTVTRGYYDQANGNTLQDSGPFTLTITSGNLTYVHPQIVLDEPIDWRIAIPSIKTVGAKRIVKKIVEKKVPNPVDPTLLMTTGVLLVKNRNLKRQLRQA